MAFIPRARTGWQRDETVRLVLRQGLAMGVVCGGVTAALVAGAPQLLTRDSAVWPFIAAVAPQTLISMVLVGFDVAATSVLLARRDLAYVARSFAVTLAALSLFMWRAMGDGSGSGPLGDALGSVWWALVFFYGVRAAQSAARLAWLASGRGQGPAAASAAQ